MTWAIGTDSERTTSTGRYEGAGTQHAVHPSKIDIFGRGRPLAPCGADVRRWDGTAWSARTGLLPVSRRVREDHDEAPHRRPANAGSAFLDEIGYLQKSGYQLQGNRMVP